MATSGRSGEPKPAARCNHYLYSGTRQHDPRCSQTMWHERMPNQQCGKDSPWHGHQHNTPRLTRNGNFTKKSWQKPLHALSGELQCLIRAKAGELADGAKKCEHLKDKTFTATFRATTRLVEALRKASGDDGVFFRRTPFRRKTEYENEINVEDRIRLSPTVNGETVRLTIAKIPNDNRISIS